MEVWKDVVGYEGLYQISDTGKIKSIQRRYGNYNGMRRERIMKQRPDSRNYINITLCKNGKHKSHWVHRLVAQAFIPNLDNKHCINHIDNNPSNNSIENLEWCTHKENSQHSAIQGRINRGEKNGSVKLKEIDIRFIRHLRQDFNLTHKQITECLFLSQGIKMDRKSIGDIINNIIWKHVK